MNLLSSFLNISFAFVFFFNQSAFAAKNLNPYDQDTIESAVELYKGLTTKEKINLMSEVFADRPKADQEAFAEILNDKDQINVPDIRLDDGKLIIEVDKKEIPFQFISKEVVMFKGEKIDFSPGKLKAAIDKITKMTTTQKWSFSSFFINEAHAVIPLIAAGIVLALMTIISFVMATGLTIREALLKKAIDGLLSKCEIAASEFDLLVSSPNAREELDTLKKGVAATRKKLRGPLFEKLNPENVCTITTANSDAVNKDCRLRKRGLACLEQLETKIRTHAEKSVNQGGRAGGKEVPGKSGTLKSKTGSKKQ